MNAQDFQKRHQPKPCKFCGGGASYAPLEPMSRRGIHIYFCDKCHAEYLYYWSGGLATVSLYTNVNGKMYRWTVSASGKEGRLWWVKKPGILGEKPNEDMESIKSFDVDLGDSFPELTPQNIESKLKIWLTFL